MKNVTAMRNVRWDIQRIILTPMKYTRREIGKFALAAPLAALAPRGVIAAEKPNSRFAGVQLGMNVPYNFGGRDMDPDELLQRCLQLNVSALELRSQPVETFLGSPGALGRKTTPEELRKWRAGVSMDRVKLFRKNYEDAGVQIHVVKFDGIYAMADDEVDYCFNLAKTLGASALSTEIAEEGPKRLGQFADTHKMKVGYHGHGATKPEHWETAFSYSKYNWANLDLGHFLAGNNTSPIAFLKQHHDRITHLHVKDRKLADGPNMPFGEADTPIKEALHLLRDNKWPIDAVIEFEYPVPAGSDRRKELARCVQYCRDALLT
jgi:sugar phosphate isomerase/epimerase